VRAEVLPDGDLCIVRSKGLEEAGLPEIEISECPLKLQDVASNLVVQIALNGKDTPESLAEGKTIGGRFVRRDQPLIESFRLARISASSSTLRVTDLDGNGVFPHRLLATHLCATAGASRRDALRLLLVSIEVWPKEKTASNAPLGDYELNPNNFWSWVDLGTTLAQAGRIEDAVLYWRTAACMWPRGGKLYASRMVVRGGTAAVHDFWQSLGNETIKNWCAELTVELPESALAD
jgi:tetratricopeptide (TPR) repeat protein